MRARTTVFAALLLAATVSLSNAMTPSLESAREGVAHLLTPEQRAALPKRVQKRLERHLAKIDKAPPETATGLLTYKATKELGKHVVEFQDGDDYFLRVLRSASLLAAETEFEACVLTTAVEGHEGLSAGKREKLLGKLAKSDGRVQEALRVLGLLLPAVQAKDPNQKQFLAALKELKKAMKANAGVRKAATGAPSPPPTPFPNLAGVTVQYGVADSSPLSFTSTAVRGGVRRVGAGDDTVWEFRLALGGGASTTTQVFAIDIASPTLTDVHVFDAGQGGLGDVRGIHTEYGVVTFDFGQAVYDGASQSLRFHVEVSGVEAGYFTVTIDADILIR